MSKTHLVTGGTGFLGSQLIVDLLKQDADQRIIAFARDTASETATHRVLAEVKKAAFFSGTPLKKSDVARIAVCDISPFKPCGDKVIDQLAQFIEDHKTIALTGKSHLVLWHSAASVSFFKSDEKQIYDINLEGSKCLAELAGKLKVDEFNYISTAYVSGNRRGEIQERLEEAEPGFNNPYESSKFFAERAVSGILANHSVPMRIFRPSVIVGHSKTYKSASETGIYGYAAGIQQYWQQLLLRNGEAALQPLQLAVPEDSTINFICVDQCVREMLALSNLSDTLGEVFHITADNNLNVRAVIAVIGDVVQVPIEFVGLEESASLSRMNRELSRRLANSGASYSTSDKIFSRNNVWHYLANTTIPKGNMSVEYMRHCLSMFFENKAHLSQLSREALLFTQQRQLTRQFNIAARILEQAKHSDPDNYAIRHSSGEVLVGDINDRIHGYVTQLVAAHGIQPGDRIAIVAGDSLPLATLLIALMHLGCTAIIVNPLLKVEEMGKALGYANVSTIFVDDSIAESLKDYIEKSIHEIQASINLLGNIEQAFADAIKHSSLVEQWEPAYTTPTGHAFGMFTSGTTGEPKLVLHRHQDFLIAAERYAAQILNVDNSDVLFSASRLSFAFGLHNMFNALLNGATAILSPPVVNADTVLQSIKDYQPTVLFAVPTLYQFILKHNLLDNADIQSLRLFVAAGERLPTDINKLWYEKVGVAILDSLGSTEAFSTYLSNFPGVNKFEATGKLVPGFDAKLIDEAGNICSNHQIGTLWIKGPSLTSRYENNPQANQRQFGQGWYCTNDVFWRDADGYFYYYGRSDDMFKVSGQWISPQEIENILLQHPIVLDAAVVPVGDCERTTRPKAFIVSNTDQPDQCIDELKEYSKTKLEKWKYPHLFEFVSELPKTPTGKIRRFALRA